MKALAIFLLLSVAIGVAPLRADNLIIYPAKGQSDQQQEKELLQAPRATRSYIHSDIDIAA